MSSKLLPVLAIWFEEDPKPSGRETKACRKATRRSLKALPPLSANAPALSPETVQRRWIRAKCDRCRKCADMVV